MPIQPYLFFEGRAEEAIGFYKKALGAEVEMLMRYNESPDKGESCAHLPPGHEEKVMHASFRVGDSLVMCSDGMCSGTAKFQGVSLSISAPNAAAAQQAFAALSDGGQVQMPFGPTFFSPAFGMVADRFGVSWMVVAEA